MGEGRSMCVLQSDMALLCYHTTFPTHVFFSFLGHHNIFSDFTVSQSRTSLWVLLPLSDDRSLGAFHVRELCLLQSCKQHLKLLVFVAVFWHLWSVGRCPQGTESPLHATGKSSDVVAKFTQEMSLWRKSAISLFARYTESFKKVTHCLLAVMSSYYPTSTLLSGEAVLNTCPLPTVLAECCMADLFYPSPERDLRIRMWCDYWWLCILCPIHLSLIKLSASDCMYMCINKGKTLNYIHSLICSTLIYISIAVLYSNCPKHGNIQ